MNRSHHSNGKHYTNVFPEPLGDLEHTFRCYERRSPNNPWFQNCLLSRFDRSELDREDAVVIFWKKLPAFLPLKTKAWIVLRSMLSSYPKPDREELEAIRKTSLRADTVILQPDFETSSLEIPARFSRKVSGEAFMKSVYRATPDSPDAVRPFDLVSYGELTPRRAMLKEALEKRFGHKFRWIPGQPSLENLRREINQARILLQFCPDQNTEGLWTMPGRLVVESAMATAYLATDYQEIYGIDQSCYQTLPSVWFGMDGWEQPLGSLLDQVHKTTRTRMIDAFSKNFTEAVSNRYDPVYLMDHIARFTGRE